jgi:hypothetical protein
MTAKRSFLVALGATVVLLAAVVNPTGAGATTNRPVPAPVVQTVNGVSGVFVSRAYQSAHPGYVQSLVGQLAGRGPGRPAVGMIPNSHYGCNHAVCIDVEGSGTHVTYWATDIVGNYGCTKAFFDSRHGQLPAYETEWGPQICSNGQSGTYISYYGNVPNDWPNGDQLCNGWIRVTGYACATIIA